MSKYICFTNLKYLIFINGGGSRTVYSLHPEITCAGENFFLTCMKFYRDILGI
jgi:hypothetical protein